MVAIARASLTANVTCSAEGRRTIEVHLYRSVIAPCDDGLDEAVAALLTLALTVVGGTRCQSCAAPGDGYLQVLHACREDSQALS